MFHEIFWGSVAGGSLVWIAWVGKVYPVLIRWAARRKGPRQHPESGRLPKVSFLVPCRNEEEFVSGKAANLRELGARLEKWEALMVDDASTDRTAEILGSVEGAGVSVIRTGKRSGKIQALRLAARHSEGEILVVTDCGCRLDPDAIRPLLEWFADPKVGLVTGCYRSVSNRVDGRSQGESEYWKGEMELRLAECSLGSTTHATGALLAVRKELFDRVEWPEGTINDDIHLPLRILELGFDVVCEPKAVATENVETDLAGEFRRRVRIATGNFQMVREIPRLLRAGRWFPVVQLVSHKLMRNALGIPLLALLAASAEFSEGLVARGGFALQLLGYSTIWFGAYTGRMAHWPRPMVSGTYAVLAIAASLVGMLRWMWGWTPVSWERTDSLGGANHA